jgi:glutamate---cysteine ligase / carboxylate-amine ligase
MLEADDVRSTFDAVESLTIGLEEEAMLLDPGTLELLPRATDLVTSARDPRFKLELPAAQLEIMLPPTATVPESVAALRTARRDLAAAAEGVGVLAAAGAHPFSSPLGRLNTSERHEAISRAYGRVAQLQLVCAFQVHVAVGGHARTLAVYNALRSFLPELAALAANAPFYAGTDSGLASVRPKICDLLPRQGVPPVISSWDAYADALRWGQTAGALPTPGGWWWELRPHPVHGTLEVRVPDSQATVADAAAVAALVHSLVGWLSARHDAGDLPAPDPTWRIEENRWSACRHGVEAVFADLRSGRRTAVRDLLAGRLEELAPTATALGCAHELAEAQRLLSANGAVRQRAAAGGDPHAAARWLADAYVPTGALAALPDG